jgi:peptidoglycan/xylan/chitin deacetylase (PgdA/CDA1 family)
MSRVGIFSRRVRAGEVCVLTYHGLLRDGSVKTKSPTAGTLLSAAQFRRQLRFLKSRYQLITPEAFHSWLKERSALPQRAVLLTCDDGLLNVLTDMVPILLEEGARCLFFVTGASLEDPPQYLWYEELYRMLDGAPGDALVIVDGKAVRKDSLATKNLIRYWWELVQELSAFSFNDRKEALLSLRTQWQVPTEGGMDDPGNSEGCSDRLVNGSELRQLAAEGMTVGAHTMSHPLLARMSAELAAQEIRECKLSLEAHLQQEVWALAYPFGDEGSAGAREMKMAEGAGYDCAFMNHGGGVMRRTSPRYALPRAHVTAEMNLAEFEAHLSGFHEDLQRRFRGGAIQSAPGQAA